MSILIPVLFGIYLSCAVGMYRLARASMHKASSEDRQVFDEYPRLSTVILGTLCALWPVVLIVVLVSYLFR